MDKVVVSQWHKWPWDARRRLAEPSFIYRGWCRVGQPQISRIQRTGQQQQTIPEARSSKQHHHRKRLKGE